jgi:zinc and cadmium transporter
VIVHEIPQEIGDFMVLLHAGYGRRRALLLNAAVSLASVAGGILGYLILEYARSFVQYAVILAAACFLYIAVADLIPHLHRQTRKGEPWWQIGLIALGVGTIGVLKSLVD